MKDCEIVRSRLGEFLAGALDGEASAAVERHLEACSACSDELVALQKLEGTLFSIEPDRARARVVRVRRLAAAAAAAAIVSLAAALWLAGSGAATVASGRIAGAGRIFTEGSALPFREPLASEAPSVVEFTDRSSIQVASSARFELLDKGNVRLDDGEAFFDVRKGTDPFEVHTPLGTVRVLGTSFLVRVAKEDRMSQSMVVKSSVAAVIVVAVATGVVLWVNHDGSTERLEAGKQLTARPGAAEITRYGPEVVAKLRGEVEALRKEKEELSKEKDALAGKVSSLSDELKAVRAKEDAKAQDEVKGASLSFGKWQDLAELTEANWKEMGQAAENLTALLKEAGEKPITEMSKELGVKIYTENSKLANLAVKLIGKLPTNIESGNGEYTHPMVNWNVMAERLELAGQPLSEDQRARVAQLGNEYETRWDQLQQGYSDQTSKLEKVMDELDLKKTYQDRMESLFSNGQREAIIDPETHHVGMGLDLHSPMLMLQMVAKPLAVDSRENLRAAVLKGWADQFKMDAGQLEAQAVLVDAWLAEVDPRLVAVPKERAALFDIQDALAAGRAQARVMRELLNTPGLSEKARARILSSPGFLVPRLVEQ